jgi:hypothetical protein
VQRTSLDVAVLTCLGREGVAVACGSSHHLSRYEPPQQEHTLSTLLHVLHCYLCRNAGTDARVMLQLVGDKGSSSPLELQDAAAPADCFLRGESTASFCRYLECTGCTAVTNNLLQA